MRKLVAAVVVAGVGVVAMAGAAQAAPPTADSGPSVEVRVGEPAQLHGSASDPDGDAVQIRWLRSAFNGGVLASCTFTGPTGFQPISDAGLNPTLTCTQPGDYLMQLVAADGTSSFDSVGALVTVTPNHPPVADSGPDVAAVVGGVAQLQGAVSDPDGDDLEIRWIRSVVSGASLANCTFSGPTSFQPVTPAGLAPTMSCSQPGQYLLQLVVGDGLLSDDDTGALVTFTAVVPPLDFTAAVCTAVHSRSTGWALRIRDAQSGVASYTSRPVINGRVSPASRSFSPPVPSTDAKVLRDVKWFPGAALVQHRNGAGRTGSCLVVSDFDGSLSVLPFP